MGNPDRIETWTNFWEALKLVGKLKWWFTFGDYILDKTAGSNNAGDFKFRTNMIILWFVVWSSLISILPGAYELFPLLAVLWAAFVWAKD